MCSLLTYSLPYMRLLPQTANHQQSQILSTFMMDVRIQQAYYFLIFKIQNSALASAKCNGSKDTAIYTAQSTEKLGPNISSKELHMTQHKQI